MLFEAAAKRIERIVARIVCYFGEALLSGADLRCGVFRPDRAKIGSERDLELIAEQVCNVRGMVSECLGDVLYRQGLLEILIDIINYSRRKLAITVERLKLY